MALVATLGKGYDLEVPALSGSVLAYIWTK
jgi:hypothetical protein